jgi:hypothetical protein
MKAYELNEKYEKSRTAPDLNSFISFISCPFPKKRRPR